MPGFGARARPVEILQWEVGFWKAMSQKVKFTPNCEKGAHGENFFGVAPDGLYTLDIKSLGVRAPRGRDFFLLSEVTTPKIGLFKMVKMQKCAPAARGARQKTWDI